jgi:DnaJ-class molecular chaperone
MPRWPSMAQPKLYKALDIDKSATDDQIKKAYR